jgi:hypothetical protein
LLLRAPGRELRPNVDRVSDAEARVVHQLGSPYGKDFAERREVALGGRVEALKVPELAVETQGL